MDTTIYHTHLFPIEKVVKKVGKERLIFGSDMPYYNKTLDKVLVNNADISEEAKECIFWKNADKLFNLNLER